MSAVAHVLTLVAALTGGVAGGARNLERHPALGSLLRALFIRVSNRSVRRAACAVLFRASYWQALGRDASATAVGSGGDDEAVMGAAGVEAVVAGGAVVAATAAKSVRRAPARSNELANVLLGSLKADLARVKTTPSARGGGGGGGHGHGPCIEGLSPVRRPRAGAARTTDKDSGGGSIGGVGNGGGRGIGEGLVPVIVPRLHLVEVTEFVAGLVHVMLESARATATAGTAGAGRQLPPGGSGGDPEEVCTSAAALPLPQQQQQQPPGSRVGATAARAPVLPVLPPRPLQLAPSGTTAAAAAAAADGGREVIASRDKETGLSVPGGIAPGARSVGGGGGVEGTGDSAGCRNKESSAAAAEWLLEEAARRLAAHEFTETFK